MRVYFLGICGTAMGNAALLLREMGHSVFGADAGVYPPMSEVLREAGVTVHEGFDAARLASLAPDLVVVGNAATRGNPEVEWLLDREAARFVSLPQLLHERVLPGRRPLVVAGTHGKTTTAALAAHLLNGAGAAPGWLIGGVPNDLASGARLGGGKPFVIEGDEYDSAFFDKRSKFIHYRPAVALVNNLEFDHADIFRDLEDVRRTFAHFLKIVPRSGHVVVNGDDANIRPLLPVPWTRVHTVGVAAANDLVIRDFRDGGGGSAFGLWWRGRLWAEVRWGLHGLFNARNAAMGALGAALAAAPGEAPAAFDIRGLNTFSGVRRRQHVLAETAERVVLEDFAHHPTAIEAVLDALRAAYPGYELWACFEPRSNTARTKRFAAEFTRALGRADRVWIGAVHRKEGLPEERCLDTAAMARELNGRGGCAAAFATNAALGEALERETGAARARVVVFFSNGAFDGVPRRFADKVAVG